MSIGGVVSTQVNCAGDGQVAAASLRGVVNSSAAGVAAVDAGSSNGTVASDC